MSQLFASGGQNIGASTSASVLPKNIKGWVPLGLTGWSPHSPRDSQETSPTPQFKSISSFTLNLLYGPTLTSIPDYWKTIALTRQECQQGNVSAFSYAVQVCHSFSSKEQVSFNFMAAVTICSDSEAQEKKICHCFHLFSFCLPWGTGCHDLKFFWMLSFKPAFSLFSFKSLFSSSFLPLKWYHLHIWGCYFSQQYGFQLEIHPAWHFAWCTLHVS